MASRFSAARPKRTGEAFARAHHGEDHSRDGATKKVKFDVRNPSALAPDSRAADDDYDEADEQVLAADVIRSTAGATKRGAVNIDGYDSDSDNETFEARAEARRRDAGKGKKGKKKKTTAEDVDLADQLDNYNAKLAPGATANGAGDDDDEDEEIDMFGAADEDEEADADGDAAERRNAGKKDKTVRFLENEHIEGQEKDSKSGGTVRLGEEESSEDEEDIALVIQEQGVDEEVGLGGLKKNAPKIDAFNMRQEQEEGAFDEAGNYIRSAADPDAVHDRWLQGLSKKEMKKAADAHLKREAELRQQRREDDNILTADLFGSLIVQLERAETPLEALARLGKSKTNKTKPKVPKWKQKKLKNASDKMEVDTETPEDPKQVKIREAINTITEAADRLLRRDYPDIYDTEREKLMREYRNETGEEWVDPPARADEEADGGAAPTTKMWEYRWIDGRAGGEKQGPYDGPTMKAWQEAGYFEGVEFRRSGDEGGEWTRAVSFV
jgi:CD2 antigen cytoplasmic tail-binding protein 2